MEKQYIFGIKTYEGVQRLVTSTLVGSGMALAGVMGACILDYDMGEHPLVQICDYYNLGIMGTAFAMGLVISAVGIFTHKERMRAAKGASSIDDVVNNQT